MNTFLAYVPSLKHSISGHPENPNRLVAIRSLIEETHLLTEVQEVEPVAALDEQLSLVHSDFLIDRVRTISARGGGHLDADTYSTADSFRLARLATGSTCLLMDKILEGAATNAIALVRPPGHHADINRVGGFCLFNNIAVAARHAQHAHHLDRILIIDFDVHHGNGTQDIFYIDPSVLFISMHLYLPFFYPGTGAISEIGEDEGYGSTVNVPFGAGAGDYWYQRTFSDLVWPLAQKHRPEAILVSAGFDGHWIDPLANAGLSLSGYSQIARELVNMANALCNGRLLFVLEGGYHLEALSFGVLNLIKAMLGHDDTVDPLGPKPDPEADMTNVLRQLIDLHLPD